MIGKLCSYCWCFRRRYSILQTSENINFSLFKNSNDTNISNQITFTSDSTPLTHTEKETSFESIFDRKFLTSTELSLEFSFTKNGFEIFINKNGSIFNKKIPVIKMFYKLSINELKQGTTIKDIDFAMNDPQTRLKWDTSLKDYKIIEGNKENYILHYIMKSPMIFVSERDVIDKRLDFYENDIYYDFSSSVKDDFIPLEENIVRMTDHCSLYKMYEEKDEFNFVSITQMDTKYKLPNAMLSYQLPLNYKKWYDSLINAINEETAQNEQIEQIEKSENSEQDEQSSERLTSSEQN